MKLSRLLRHTAGIAYGLAADIVTMGGAVNQGWFSNGHCTYTTKALRDIAGPPPPKPTRAVIKAHGKLDLVMVIDADPWWVSTSRGTFNVRTRLHVAIPGIELLMVGSQREAQAYLDQQPPTP